MIPSSHVLRSWEQGRVYVNVSDLGSGVLTVIISWLKGGETIWQNETMEYSSGELYEAGTPYYGGGNYNVSYMITAYDRAGNKGVRNNAGYYFMYYGVIPEFPSFLILPLFLIATLLAVVANRRRHSF